MSTQQQTVTPGNWQAIHWTCHAATTVVVAAPSVVTGKRVIAECETEGDARLIAAAPDLLAAMKEMVAAQEAFADEYLDAPYGPSPETCERFDRAKEAAIAAIAKAEGRS